MLTGDGTVEEEAVRLRTCRSTRLPAEGNGFHEKVNPETKLLGMNQTRGDQNR